MGGADGWLSEAQARALSELAESTLRASTDVLSDLVLRRVHAGAPDLRVLTWEGLMAGWPGPRVIVRVEYVSGIEGTNLLIVEAAAAQAIAALMMGEPPQPEAAGDLDELHLSALAEAMNQMMGSAATSLSERLGRSVIISPPTTRLEPGGETPVDLPAAFGGADALVAVLSYPLRIEDDLEQPVESRVVQVFPLEFARRLADEYLARQSGQPQPSLPEAARTAGAGASSTPAGAPAFPAPTPAPQAPPAAAPAAAPAGAGGAGAAAGAGGGARVAGAPSAARWQAPDLSEPQPGSAGAGGGEAEQEPDHIPLEVIRRITVPVTVRLGQAYLPLEEVLSLSRGSIVPLD
ncbi:MAG TPA: chemotaxis protein CheC, partial [Limnochordales bacterium]